MDLEKLKSLSLRIQERTSKILQSLRQKRKQYVRQIIYTTKSIYLRKKVIPVIGYTDEPTIQWEVPVIENTFADDCKITDKNDK